MKKMFKSVLALSLSAVMLTGVTACKPSGTVIQQGDASKTQLNVYSYAGGVGNVWLDKIEERFEEAYKDYEFEPGTGKKGVDLILNKTKTGANLTNMQNSNDHVFFSEWIDIPTLIAQGKVIDIHDVVTTPLNEFLDGKTTDTETIEEKLYPQSQKFFSHKVVNGENRYFGLPHYSHFPAFIYNKAYFDMEKLYFAKEPDLEVEDGQFITDDNPVKSCGPDGVCGNEDDGLPATWDEMFELFDYIVDKGDKPMIWAGSSAYGYTKYMLTSAFLNLAGAEVANYNWTFDSAGKQVDIVTGFDNDDNPILGKATITPSDDSALNKLLAKWQAIEIFDKIVDNRPYMHDTCIDTTAQMLDGQKDFILSANENKPAAILLEGSYWYNESMDAGFFDEARATYDDYDEKNDYQIMPLPRVYTGTASDVEGTNVHKSVATDQSDSFACISAKLIDNPDLLKVAKLFLAYCYTEESLAQFTEVTNTVRYLKYDVDESKLSDYGKSVWNYVKNSDLVLPYSNHTKYLSDKLVLSLHIESTFWEYGSGDPWALLRGSSNTAVNFFKKYMVK